MKVPPKRKGNPEEIKGLFKRFWETLNESPSEKEGKYHMPETPRRETLPSMKVPPKRKGNYSLASPRNRYLQALNESPSEKEGKSKHMRHQAPLAIYPQ